MAKLSKGDTRIAHTRSGESGEDEVVIAAFDDRGVLVTWPRAIGWEEGWALNTDRQVPEPLIVRDGQGWLTLCGGHPLGASMSSLGHSQERIRYRRAIHTGARGRSYSEVNGMTSEIEGLAKWAKLTPVTQQLLFDEDRRLKGVSITAENIDSVSLGGPLDLRLLTSYHHNPSPRGGRYVIDTSLLVRTNTETLVDWAEHRSAHQMIQDLMSLAYGKPCGATLVSVMREDDQEHEPTDDRRYWRDAYEPSFGRNSLSAVALKEEAEPLFYLDEVDPSKVQAWLNAVAIWGRPTWIAVTAMFHKDLPVESRLVQVAVALEALGYAIAKHNLPDETPPWSFKSKVRLVFGAIGYGPDAVLGKLETQERWLAGLNEAYNGVKHADNALTEAAVAWDFAEQGLTLFRCWLAAYLGVDPAIVQSRLAR